MPPQLALLICISLILYLFWMDRKNNEGISHAIWIPFIWLFLSCSRYVSQWLNLGTPNISAGAITDGSPLDRAVFILLIIAGVLILRQRRINWNALFTQDAWIWLYFVFGAVSFLWSDYPFVSFKRWIKASGTVIMVLVVSTEERPYLAIGVILKRLAFLLLPLSVLFIKFYPDLGRAYHMGKPMFTGVAGGKNGLGKICLLAGIYFSWNLLLSRSKMNVPGQRLHYSIYLIILPMIAWLFYMANSATSLACMIVAICLFAVCRQPAIVSKPQRILPFGIACVALFGIMEFAFDVKDIIISMLGRRPDLTTRVPMWEDLLSLVKNPLLGVGYESFWLGDRRQYMADHWNIVCQAHNGYLEMYLNMGLIGLLFVLGWIVSGLKKVQRYLYIDYPAAMLRLCFIIVITLFNYTEATFFSVSSMWMLLFLAVMSVPERQEHERNGRQH
jgi:O-antigen ligase